ncbi:MAG: ion transporter [Polyangiaceae bacterium]|nr:ion transporter [Polyangiaceae bacterium]
MAEYLRTIAESKRFQNFVTWVIIFAGVLVGVETYPGLVAQYGDTLHTLDKIVLGIFVVEILVKVGAEGNKPWRFFSDNWNVFDFIIVAAAFLPISSQYVTVLRLARLLRVLRLVRALPKLQLLVSALLKSIPSMAYVSLLLFLLFYVYAVAAVFLFGANDPIHFRNLQIALVSLFRAVTLEDWTDLMYIQMYGCNNYGYDGDPSCTDPQAYPILGALFFVSFVLLGTMVVLNLFIGVIMNGMTEAQKEADDLHEADRVRAGLAAAPETLSDELGKLEKQLAELQGTMANLARRARLEQEGQDAALGSSRPVPAPAE